MAYDFHGKWERETGHNAPLYSSSLDSEWQKQLSVDHAATMWVKLGAPKEKLIIGMPTYGRSFTLSNVDNFRVHAAANGGGKAGEYTKESGFLAYYEVWFARYSYFNDFKFVKYSHLVRRQVIFEHFFRNYWCLDVYNYYALKLLWNNPSQQRISPGDPIYVLWCPGDAPEIIWQDIL